MPAVELGRVTLEDCCDCGGGDLLTWSCQSLTGTAILCGFSAWDDGSYDAGNPELWEFQYRKWFALNRQGANGFLIERSSGIDTVRKTRYTGSQTISLSTTETGEQSCSSNNDCVIEEGFEQGAEPITAYEDLTTSYLSSDCGSPAPYGDQEVIFDGLSLSVTVGTPESGTGFNTTYYSDVYFDLTKEVYFYDSLEELLTTGEGVEVGTECCNALSDANTLPPGSTSSHAFTGTAVRAAFTPFSAICDPLNPIDVEVTIVIERTVSGVTTTREIYTTGKCGQLNYYYLPMPLPGTPGWCLVDVFATLDP
jgi:hypothetical protein